MSILALLNKGVPLTARRNNLKHLVIKILADAGSYRQVPVSWIFLGPNSVITPAVFDKCRLYWLGTNNTISFLAHGGVMLY